MIMLTIATLFYVHQNIEIVKLGYSINNKEKTLTYFLDQQKRLVYNLNKLESPSVLNKKLSYKDIELVQTDKNSIYYVSAKNIEMANAGNINNYRTSVIDGFLDTLTVKAQAQQKR